MSADKKPIFNPDDYGKGIAMICESEQEADTFMIFLDSIGEHWSDGSFYIPGISEWDSNFGSIAYFFREGKFSRTYDKELAVEEGRAVFFKDFDWNNEEHHVGYLESDSLDAFLSSFITKEVMANAV